MRKRERRESDTNSKKADQARRSRGFGRFELRKRRWTCCRRVQLLSRENLQLYAVDGFSESRDEMQRSETKKWELEARR